VKIEIDIEDDNIQSLGGITLEEALKLVSLAHMTAVLGCKRARLTMNAAAAKPANNPS
jgi:hypothetical protein